MLRSLVSSSAVRISSSFSSTTSALLPLKSKRCLTSFIVWSSALTISARFTCETMSNEFCCAISINVRWPRRGAGMKISARPNPPAGHSLYNINARRDKVTSAGDREGAQCAARSIDQRFRQIDAEEAGEVLGGDAAQLLRARAAQFREKARGLDDVGGFVPPPAQRHGREVRAVGFDEEPVGRHAERHLAQLVGLLESHVARERDHEAEAEHFVRHPLPAAEAVHDAAQGTARRCRAKHLDRLFVRLARVDDDGQPRLARDPELTREDLALHVARRVVVMIVKPDLAPRDDALAPLDQRPQQPLRLPVIKPRVVRVDADRRVHALVLLRDRHRPLEITRPRVARPHVQDRAHARRTRARDHLVAIRVVLPAVNVRVRIDKHGRRLVSRELRNR